MNVRRLAIVIPRGLILTAGALVLPAARRRWAMIATTLAVMARLDWWAAHGAEWEARWLGMKVVPLRVGPNKVFGTPMETAPPVHRRWIPPTLADCPSSRVSNAARAPWL